MGDLTYMTLLVCVNCYSMYVYLNTQGNAIHLDSGTYNALLYTVSFLEKTALIYFAGGRI